MSPDVFWACRSCWRRHSGVAPTTFDGVMFRPVGYDRHKHATCRFCKGDMWGDMFRYEPAVCVECDGAGEIWDSSFCGDPEHCSPKITCSACDGSGWAA